MLEGIGRFAHARHGFCVVALCQGKIRTRDFYAFVAIEPQNYGYFKKTYQEGAAANFHAYGQELLRGWGKEPPQKIINYVRSKHGVEFDVGESFLERLLAQASASPFPLKPAAPSASFRTHPG